MQPLRPCGRSAVRCRSRRQRQPTKTCRIRADPFTVDVAGAQSGCRQLASRSKSRSVGGGTPGERDRHHPGARRALAGGGAPRRRSSAARRLGGLFQTPGVSRSGGVRGLRAAGLPAAASLPYWRQRLDGAAGGEPDRRPRQAAASRPWRRAGARGCRGTLPDAAEALGGTNRARGPWPSASLLHPRRAPFAVASPL